MSYRDYSVANGFIVDSSGKGDFTTIGAALTAASSGTDIFIRDGTYTENPALKAGVNLVAFTGDNSTPNVIIVGKCTFSGAGTISISNVQLQTNSDYVLQVTGSAASAVYLRNCTLNLTNNAGINLTSSSASSLINLYGVIYNQNSTYPLYICNTAGTLSLNYIESTNGAVTTPSTFTGSGIVAYLYCTTGEPITSSGASSFAARFSYFQSGVDLAAFTFDGTGAFQYAQGCTFKGQIVINNTFTLNQIGITSNQTNAVSGSGTVDYGVIEFDGSSQLINTTTQSNLNGGTFTPVLALGGGSTGITYVTQLGTYYRSGNTVFFNVDITLSSLGSSTGAATISGLPIPSGSLYSDSFTNLLLCSEPGATYFFTELPPTSTTLGLYSANATTGSYATVTDANLTGSSALRIQGTYFV